MANYRRVSRKRPCRICGKPDWCSTTPDERIRFCARLTSDSDRISPEGWGVFYNAELPTARFTRHLVSTGNTRPQLAPIEVRDFVYRKLIEFAPAQSSQQILRHPEGLCHRKIYDLANFGSLPGSRKERNKLANRIAGQLVQAYPVGGGNFPTQGVPGFWTDRYARVRLWSEYDFDVGLLLIPVVNRRGLIQACLLRPMATIPDGSSRYFWLSSAGKCGGSSPGSPLHYATSSISLSRPMLVTEGPLKAQTAKSFFPGHDIVASSGVSCSHSEIVSAARYRPIEIAFDSDSFENPHVAGALARLLNLRLADQKAHGYDEELNVLAWDRRAKGLDEALIKGFSIKALTASNWYAQLSPQCQSVATSSLAHIPFVNRGGQDLAKQKSGGRRCETTLSKQMRYDRLRAVIA